MGLFYFATQSILALAILATSPARADVALAGGKSIGAGSVHWSAAVECFRRVDEARTFAAAVLGRDNIWVDTEVTCEVAEDSGCGSAMDGAKLRFLTGAANCDAAVFNPSYVYHEWAHGLNHRYARVFSQHLDEALADVFAVYMTGDPKFGRGMHRREMSWQRDLSDRKIYDGETKQVYTQSLTLSGAWWDLRVRLARAFGEKAGARLSSELFLNHYEVIAALQSAPEFARDYEYATRALALLKHWSGSTRTQVSCALSNAFLDHGFGTLARGCEREPLLTEDEKTLELERASTSKVMSASRSTLLPAPIPDDDTLVLEFNVGSASTNVRARAIVLRLNIDHPYAEDLMVRLTAPDGERHEIYKGEEELRVPEAITDRGLFKGSRVQGQWRVEIVSSGAGMSGVVRAASLVAIAQ